MGKGFNEAGPARDRKRDHATRAVPPRRRFNEAGPARDRKRCEAKVVTVPESKLQ